MSETTINEGTEVTEVDETTETPLSISEVTSDLLEEISDWKGTPYQVHTVLKGVLEVFQVTKDGKEYRVPPQMMYNYDRNGLIVKGQKGQKRYTREETAAFVVRFVSKQLDK